MSKPKLSILICTLPERKHMLDELLNVLHKDMDNLPISRDETGEPITNQVEIICDDEVGINVGHKRNNLLKQSTGKFIVFIDDDDMVSSDYVSTIYDTIVKNPNADCIGINGIYTTDGEDKRKWFISKEYGKWYEENKIFYRTPNHISPVLRQIAITVGFPSIDFGEDYHYSMGILQYLKKEAIIDKSIYHYRFNSRK